MFSHKFKNDEVSYELRSAGLGYEGYWTIQHWPVTIFDKGLGTVVSFYHDLDSFLECVKYGHAKTAYGDVEALRDLGVPSSRSGWTTTEEDVGALELYDGL